MRRSPGFPRLPLPALLAVAIAGCRPSSSPPEEAPARSGETPLSEIEKAQLIKEKRVEARDLIEKYQASGSIDTDALERAAELQRETTEIAPATCPRCWAEYGEALSMLGYHSWFLENELQAEIGGADPSTREDLEKKAAGHRAEWTKRFEESNRAYEAYFNSAPAIHPYNYERVMRHYELLGNFDRALFYIEKYVEAYPMLGEMDEASRQRIEMLRRLYRGQVRKDGAEEGPR